MPSPWKKQPEDVVDNILKRAVIRKIARRLQNRLALAQFKTKHGWEDLTLDFIEPKLEEEMRRRSLCDGDVLPDSSSSVSDLLYPTKTLISSPLKPPLFSDAVGSSNESSGHRKRTYFASFDLTTSSPSKRFRRSPTAHKSISGHSTWKDRHQLAQSSPIKPRRQQHFTNSSGPDVSFFQPCRMTAALTSPNFTAPSDDDDLLSTHSFSVINGCSSPPRTPPMQTRSLTNKRSKENLDAANGSKTPASPSPAVKSNPGLMERLSTPPPRNSKLDLPSSLTTTPGGGNLFPNTPGQVFDFADFVNITPSPAQKPCRSPGLILSPNAAQHRQTKADF